MRRIQHHILAIPFLIFLSFLGCEGMKKKIDIDLVDFPPKISVSASLDAGMGTFSMRLYEGRSLVSFDRNSSEQIVRNGAVELYQNGGLIWSLSGAFDLSRNKMDFEDINGVYKEVIVTGLQVKAGSVYRLEIDIDGYQKVIAAGMMPDHVQVDDAAIDIDNLVKKNNIGRITGRRPEGYLYSATCTISDNSPEQNYYAIQIFRRQTSNDPDKSAIEVETGVGIFNPAILQDNPNMETRFSLLDEINNFDLYWFNTLLLSDLTFSGKSVALDLFTSTADTLDLAMRRQRPPDYQPALHGPEIIIENKWEMSVAHISTEMFMHYRSLVLQGNGMGFFSEPIMIVSNVENGFGCFSLRNTRRIVLKEYQSYYYPQNTYQLK